MTVRRHFFPTPGIGEVLDIGEQDVFRVVVYFDTKEKLMTALGWFKRIFPSNDSQRFFPEQRQLDFDVRSIITVELVIEAMLDISINAKFQIAKLTNQTTLGDIIDFANILGKAKRPIGQGANRSDIVMVYVLTDHFNDYIERSRLVLEAEDE